MHKLITTSTNFDFIQRSFIEAKKDLIKANKLQEQLNTSSINAALKAELDSLNIRRLKGIGLEGATRTGKSWDICVFICHYVTTYKGKQINVCRDNFSTLRKTFYQTLKQVWSLYGLPMSHFNKTATEIHYNDNVIRFVGVNDDIMVAHGLESDLLIGNEFMGVAHETFNHLAQRTKEFFILDYNPSAVESYLFDLELREDYRCHKTTIFDNPYAPSNAKQHTLSYAHPDCDDYHIAEKAGYTKEEWAALKEKNLAIGTADKFMWEVYGLGMRSVSEDIIFPNWETYVEEPDSNAIDWIFYGGDFGFKSDPSACVKVTKCGNTLYLKEMFYEHGLLNNDIADKMRLLGINKELSIWDRAEEKSVFEMIQMDVNAWYSDKGVGSVSYSIQKMQQFKLKVHFESLHLQNELRKYRWAKDRQGNYKINTMGKRMPIKKDDHTIDPVRYVLLYNYFEPVENGD